MGKQEGEIDDLKLAKSTAIKNVKLAARKVLNESDFYVIRSMTIGTTVTINTIDNGGCGRRVEKDKQHNPRKHERTNYVEYRNAEGNDYIGSTNVCVTL